MTDITVQVSQITNTLTSSSSTIQDGDTVTWHSQTKFGNGVGGIPIPTNPYPATYVTKINWDQFHKPEVTGYTGGFSNPSFSYVANDPDLGGKAWVYDSGVYFFWLEETWSMDFTTVVLNTSGQSSSYTRSNVHGQDGDWGSSGGHPAWRIIKWVP